MRIKTESHQMSFEFGGELVELGDTESWRCICGKCSTEWPLLVSTLDMLKIKVQWVSNRSTGGGSSKENTTFRNAKSRKHRKLQSF